MVIPTICEPIAAGLFVSLFNKFILNNHMLTGCCQNLFYIQQVIEHPDDASSTTTTTTLDTELINHIHHS